MTNLRKVEVNLVPATALQEHLESLGACPEAREWAGARTATETWEQCERADWLLWWAAKTEANTHQQVVLAACACARRALRFVPEGEDRPRLAIEAAERWAAEPTKDNQRAAAWAAAEAAAAAWAAAEAAAWAAAAAAWAARAAAWAAEAAAWAAAAEHKELCVLIRAMLVLPWKEVAPLRPKA